MYIPHLWTARSVSFCPASLVRRDISDTAHAFKSWSTCMDNTGCKIIAIAGIAVCALLCLWIFIAVVRCCMTGFSVLSSCCFCCCSDRHPSMDPQLQYAQPVQPIVVEQPIYRDVPKSSPPPEYGYVGNYGDRRPQSNPRSNPWDDDSSTKARDQTRDIEMERYGPDRTFTPPASPFDRKFVSPQKSEQNLYQPRAIPPPAGSLLPDEQYNQRQHTQFQQQQPQQYSQHPQQQFQQEYGQFQQQQQQYQNQQYNPAANQYSGYRGYQ
ncbi:hypothetical protein TRVA0_024S01618 [Trichomonascus vanleenenianus]|uniref:uncharacterized protein n=1 Tax=Trichomonascus vanleenenianus TaxID=2268995 RepID=UPI003EC99146